MPLPDTRTEDVPALLEPRNKAVILPGTGSLSIAMQLDARNAMEDTCQMEEHTVWDGFTGDSPTVRCLDTTSSTSASTSVTNILPETSKFIPQTRCHDHYVPKLEKFLVSVTENSTGLATSLHHFHNQFFFAINVFLREDTWGLRSPEKVKFGDVVFSSEVFSALETVSDKILLARSEASKFLEKDHTCKNHASKVERLCANMKAGKWGPDIDIHRLVDHYVFCRLESLAQGVAF